MICKQIVYNIFNEQELIVAILSEIPKISGLEKKCRVTCDVRQQNIVCTSWVNFYYELPNYFFERS